LDLAKEAKDTESKKKIQLCIDMVEKYLESGLEGFSDEKKYNFMNKFGPKKCPDQQVKRSELKHLYSWQHYAPLQWFDHLKRTETEIKNAREGKPAAQKLCSNCQSPEGETLKHKVCSACKQMFYCSIDCQRNHWKGGHKEECKELQKKPKK
jgi:hypothetical protein